MSLLTSLKSMLSGGRVDVRSRFEVLREAISGTMSEFYKARDRQNGRIVGLKILDAAKTAVFESRFKGLKKPTEGEIAVSLVHPHVVTTYEHGLTTSGQQYLVMEFLDGPGMNSLIIGRDSLLAGRRIAFLRQTAEALEAVHKAGYIHRDMCPRNLVLDERCESLKLIDFGLTVPASPEFMQPGNRTGTPNYMAPEIAKRQKTDQRLDIFAFGVTAYEILTFELPWERGPTDKVIMAHANRAPTDIREHRPRINARLAKAVASCLERDPAARCSSISLFLKMIRDVKHEDGS